MDSSAFSACSLCSSCGGSSNDPAEFFHLAGITRLAPAFAYSDFRLFWAAGALITSGMQVGMVAQAWLLFDITGNPLLLGLLGFAPGIPGIASNLAGGVLADKFDRRRVMMAGTISNAAVFLAIATLTLTGAVQVWHILGAGFLIGGLQAFEGPARQAIFPHLVSRQHLTNAVSLISAMNPSVRIFAPIAIGFLIDGVGVGYEGAETALFAVSGLYLGGTAMMMLVRMPKIERALGGGLQTMVEGARFLKTHRTLAFLLLMAFVHGIGMSYTTILPVFAVKFEGESSGLALGFLFAAGGVGGTLGALTGGALSGRVRPAVLMVGGGVTFGLALATFSFLPLFGLVLLVLLMASLGNNVFQVTGQSALQSRLPDSYRGRVMGFWTMQFIVFVPLGALGLGAVAGAYGAPVALAISGSFVGLFALFGGGLHKGIRNLGHAESAEQAKTR
jgi:MFS family permease